MNNPNAAINQGTNGPFRLSALFNREMDDNLKTFRTFELILAAVCITIPLLLRLADFSNPHFRCSISAYFDVHHAYFFGMLLCIPAMLFIFNGAVYFRRELPRLYDEKGKWYNVILGFSLLMVICFNCEGYIIIHIIFAVIFFFGNAAVMAFGHHERDHIRLRVILALITVLAIVLGKIFHLLFWGEWISLVVIGIHFIMVTGGMITLASNTQNSEKMI